MAISNNSTYIFDFNDFASHKVKPGVVSYGYNFETSDITLRGNSNYAIRDFNNFFRYSIEQFKKSYRTYMNNLYKREYEYTILNHHITIQTDNISHAFGIPSTSAEMQVRNKYLYTYFDSIIRQDYSTGIQLEKFNQEEYDEIKDYVQSVIQQVNFRFHNMSSNISSANEAAKTYELELTAISNIIFNGSGEHPSLKDLCIKYANVEGINAYLLNALITCNQVYQKMLNSRHQYYFTYDLTTNNSQVGELLINDLVREILYYCKESPANLRSYFIATSNVKKFMEFMEPFILKININYAPNASLDVISEAIKGYYPNITTKIRKIMESTYIKSKDTKGIKVNASYEDFLSDNLLEDELNDYDISDIQNQIDLMINEYCGIAHVNNLTREDYFTNIIECLGLLSDDKGFTGGHWKYTAGLYFYEKKLISEYEKKKESYYRQLDKETDEEKKLELQIEIEEIDKKIENSMKFIDEYLKLIKENINLYNEVLIERQIIDTSSLNEEIVKFKSNNNQNGKINPKQYPILASFFNGANNTFPLSDNFIDGKVYAGKSRAEIDKYYGLVSDELFELTEMLRTQIYMQDIDETIRDVLMDGYDIQDRSKIIEMVAKKMIESYDFPYIFRKMVDSEPVIKAFKDDFINGNKTFNWIRLAEKCKAIPRITTAFLQNPMIKRIDSEILTQFRKDGPSVIENKDETYVKRNNSMIGYFFELPIGKDKADLVFIEPRKNNGVIVTNKGSTIFEITHVFRDEQLSGPITPVIAKLEDDTYGVENYRIKPGSILSIGEKTLRNGKWQTSFYRGNYFPTTFSRYFGYALGNIDEEKWRRFEIMLSGDQLATTSSGSKISVLEQERLRRLVTQYKNAATVMIR